MATLILQGVGLAVGGPVGGFIGGVVGSLVDAAIFGKDTPQEGPKLTDTGVSISADGTIVPDSWGLYPRVGVLTVSAEINPIAHEQEAGGKGLPTQTFVTYTHVVPVCQFDFGHGVGKLLKLKINKTLLYDSSSGSDGVQSDAVQFTFYDGSQVLPDADIDALVGEGNSPAYMGKIVIVFRGWSVETFGNPNTALVEALIVKDPTDAATSETIAADPRSFAALASVDYDDSNHLVMMTWESELGTNDSSVVIIDPHSRRVLWKHNITDSTHSIAYFYTFRDPESLLANYVNNRIFVQEDDEYVVYDTRTKQELFRMPNSTAFGQHRFYQIKDGVVFRHKLGAFLDAVLVYYPGSGTIFFSNDIPVGFSLRAIAKIDEDRVLLCLERDSDNLLAFQSWEPEAQVNGGDFGTLYVSTWSNLDGTPTPHGTLVRETGLVYWAVNASGPKLYVTDQAGAQVDEVDYTALGSSAAFVSNYAHTIWHDPVTGIIYDHNNALARLYNPSSNTLELVTTPSGTRVVPVYHPQTDRLWVGNDTGSAYAIRLHNLDGTLVNVADIIDDINTSAGIPIGNTDTSLITDTVVGYGYSRRMTYRALQEGILPYALAIGVSTGHQLKYVKRGAAAISTLTNDELAVRIDGEPIKERYVRKMPPANASPTLVDVGYLDVDADGETGSQPAKITTGNFDRRQDISMPVMMTSTQARQLADVWQQILYNSDPFEELRLMPNQVKHEPGDVVEIPAPDGNHRTMLTEVTRSPHGIMECKAISDDVDAVVSYLEGPFSQSASTIKTLSPPQLIIVDTPLLRDSDVDHPGTYLTSFTYSAGYAPASIHASPDGSNFTPSGNLSIECKIGQTDTIPTVVAFDAIDTMNSIIVDFYEDVSLQGYSDAAMLDGEGGYLWGDTGRFEVIQAGIVVSTGDRQWSLDRLLRGRRGTEWAMDMHQAGDLLIRLDPQAFIRDVIAVGSIGNQRIYKIVNGSGVLSEAPPVLTTVGSNPLKPYSVIDPSASFDGGNDMDMSYTRRTRRGGAYGGAGGYADGVGGPLAEETESYEIDLFNDDTGGTFLRTVTSATEAATYTYAEQTTDDADVTSSITGKIYQMSASVGRGYVTEVTATRTVTFTNVAVASNIATYLGNLTTSAPQNIYDENDTTKADSRFAVPQSTDCWTGVEFTSVRTIRRVRVYQPGMTGTVASFFYVEYSDNGSTWTQGVQLATGNDQDNTYDIPNYGAHLYWRVFTDDPSADTWWRLNTVELIEASV